MHRLGHSEDFRGPFDVIMSYWYLPNPLVAELYLKASGMRSHAALRGLATGGMILATLVVGIGTYYFVRFYWGPGILQSL